MGAFSDADIFERLRRLREGSLLGMPYRRSKRSLTYLLRKRRNRRQPLRRQALRADAFTRSACSWPFIDCAKSPACTGSHGLSRRRRRPTVTSKLFDWQCAAPLSRGTRTGCRRWNSLARACSSTSMKRRSANGWLDPMFANGKRNSSVGARAGLRDTLAGCPTFRACRTYSYIACRMR